MSVCLGIYRMGVKFTFNFNLFDIKKTEKYGNSIHFFLKKMLILNGFPVCLSDSNKPFKMKKGRRWTEKWHLLTH